MRITSKDLPQADRLESVLLTVIAVGQGARTDIEIANRIPGIEGDDRQGRYYRNAAEMLGFIINRRNNATLTPKGEKVLENAIITNPLFISSVLNLKVYQKLLPFLEIHSEGLTRQDITEYLQSMADPYIGRTMIPRRISTILTWPKTIGFIKYEDGKLYLENNLNRNLPVFEIQDIDQPILPTTGDLNEYQEISQRTDNAKSEITYYKNQARLERSINSHIYLVNLVAEQIREHGAIPKSNQLIDLAVRFDHDYIFEMKSTTKSNVRSQIRKGLSQLYEYSYLQNLQDAKLVLVIEKPLEISNSWMLDYMENDRNIHLVWDGDDKLFGTEKTRDELNFLNLLP